jgi:hypothetical protein
MFSPENITSLFLITFLKFIIRQLDSLFHTFKCWSCELMVLGLISGRVTIFLLSPIENVLQNEYFILFNIWEEYFAKIQVLFTKIYLI